MGQIWLRSDGRVEKRGGVQTDRQRFLQLYIVDCQTAKISLRLRYRAVPIHDVATREKHLPGSELAFVNFLPNSRSRSKIFHPTIVSSVQPF